MKILYITLLLLLSVTPAFCDTPWGSLKDMPIKETKKFFIDEVLSGGQINYCIDGDLSRNNADEYAQRIENSFNVWPTQTYKFIQESGRADEFKDLKNILTSEINLKRVQCSDEDYFKEIPSVKKGSSAPGYFYNKEREDIRFILGTKAEVEKECKKANVSGCFYHGAKVESPYIIVSMSDLEDNSLLIHEIGHAFNQSDQYGNYRARGNVKWGTSDNLPSIMWGAQDFQCDDAEGFINQLDCGSKKQKHRGGKVGWRSICPGREVTYIDCRVKDREDFVVKSDDGVVVASYDAKGRVKKITEVGHLGAGRFYDIVGKQTYVETKTDKEGRLSFKKDKDGIETYYTYNKLGIKAYSLGKDPISRKEKGILTETDVLFGDTGDSVLIVSNMRNIGRWETVVSKTASGVIDAFSNITVFNGKDETPTYSLETKMVGIANGDMLFNILESEMNVESFIYFPKNAAPRVCKVYSDLAACKMVVYSESGKVSIVKEANADYVGRFLQEKHLDKANSFWESDIDGEAAETLKGILSKEAITKDMVEFKALQQRVLAIEREYLEPLRKNSKKEKLKAALAEQKNKKASLNNLQ